MSGENIVNALAGLLIVTSLLVIETKKPSLSAILYSVQSLVLVGIFLTLAISMQATPLYIWAFTALITKVILVPLILYKSLAKVGNPDQPQAVLSPSMSLLIAAIIIGVAFAVVTPFHLQAIIKLKPALAVSIAHFFLGLLCILSQRNIFKQMLGYCLMENGSHLTLAMMAYNAPETVEIGILTDAIFAVIIMAVIGIRIFKTANTLDTDKLTLLKG
ncbi:Hydrogenase-4 component E [Thermoflexales bacterium]|jgi:hydrogenase-4 component E|nr:Hydrogenase-4 component E [Thermoflexales bacterium]